MKDQSGLNRMRFFSWAGSCGKNGISACQVTALQQHKSVATFWGVWTSWAAHGQNLEQGERNLA